MNKSGHAINSLTPDKHTLRKMFKQIRKKKYVYLESHPEQKIFAFKGLEENLFKLVDEKTKKLDFDLIKIACFSPIKDEIDCLTYLKNMKRHFEEQGKILKICLPGMFENERALKFFEYEEDSTILTKYNIKEPDPKTCKEIVPYLILTPLLAFDCYKHRLGYGKGFYDNTFIKLKNEGIEFISIGIAYDEQFYEKHLPIDEYDQHLNYVITPTKIL
jgi:5-formyltetrahydrofolate cyclo-ligase